MKTAASGEPQCGQSRLSCCTYGRSVLLCELYRGVYITCNVNEKQSGAVLDLCWDSVDLNCSVAASAQTSRARDKKCLP